jgi:intein/homing endonuclease
MDIFIFMKYKYHQNAFNDLTENCFYFLGFICADGCLKKTGEIAININEKDVIILEKLQQYLQTKKPIYHYNKTKSVMFTFGNKHIFDNVLKFGLTTNKSLTLKFPNNIPDRMVNHFIRGYFDGDGCVSSINRKRTNSLRINIVGTFEFLTDLQRYVSSKTGISHKKISLITKNKNTYQLNYKGKNDIMKIKDFLYYNSNIHLDRKYEIFNIDITTKKIDTTTSKYKNICYRKKNNKWSSFYYENSKRIEKSGFKTEEDAYNFLKTKMGLLK